MTSFQRERERLARRLRELRQDARLTGRQLAATNGWPPSKITKIEQGRQTPSDADVEAWANTCGNPEVIGDLTAALRALDGYYLEHRRKFRAGRSGPQCVLAEREAACTAIRVFQTSVIPGLLQTPDYTRRMLRRNSPYGGSASEMDDTIAARMARQQVLYQAGKKVHLIITEASLRCQFGSVDIMSGQLDRLLGAATTQTIRFGIVPFDADCVDPPLHGFTILDEEEVRIEMMTASLTLSEPSEIRAYLDLFAHYAEVAVYGAEARALIMRAMAELPITSDDDQNH